MIALVAPGAGLWVPAAWLPPVLQAEEAAWLQPGAVALVWEHLGWVRNVLLVAEDEAMAPQ